MSDNLSVSQQQAVAQEDQRAEKMDPSSAEHTDGSNSFEEEEHAEEDAATDEQKEDAAEALAAVADAVSKALHRCSTSSLSYLSDSALALPTPHWDDIHSVLKHTRHILSNLVFCRCVIVPCSGFSPSPPLLDGYINIYFLHVPIF